jgi:hypothetical protein
MKFLPALLAAATAIVSTPANAAYITRTYDFSASFDLSAPSRTISGSFTMEFDPMARENAWVKAFSSKQLNGYQFDAASFNNGNVSFGNCNRTGCTAGSSTNTFFASFKVDADGNVLSVRNSDFVYGKALTCCVTWQSTSFVVNRVGGTIPAVPEPATWATMMLGFGVIGYALRRRTVLRFV